MTDFPAERRRGVPASVAIARRLLRRVSTERPIPAGPMPWSLKAVVAAEILSAYGPCRWRMRRHDVRDVVRAGRSRQPSATAAHAPADAELTAARLGYAVTRTLRVLPTDSRCLVQALVLTRLLARRGIPSRLVIGARSRPAFEAHAWVEYEGRPVLSPAGFGDARLVEL